MAHSPGPGISHRTRPAVIVLAVLVTAVAFGCGGGDNGGEPAAWCDDLDRIIERGWDYDERGGNHGDDAYVMSDNAYTYIREYRSYTDEELASLKDALDEAESEGIKHDGKEGGRVWERSIRDAC